MRTTIHMQYRPRALASRVLNTDPKPYYIAEVEERHSRERIRKESLDGERGSILYNLAQEKPRPEYNNSPNPILVAFRADCILSTGPTVAENASAWLRALNEDAYDYSYAGATLDKVYEELSDVYDSMQIEWLENHARAVLQRLAGPGRDRKPVTEGPTLAQLASASEMDVKHVLAGKMPLTEESLSAVFDLIAAVRRS